MIEFQDSAVQPMTARMMKNRKRACKIIKPIQAFFQKLDCRLEEISFS